MWTDVYENTKRAIPVGIDAMQKLMTGYTNLYERLQDLYNKPLSWNEKLERKYLTQLLIPYVGALDRLPIQAAQIGMAIPSEADYRGAMADYYRAQTKLLGTVPELAQRFLEGIRPKTIQSPETTNQPQKQPDPTKGYYDYERGASIQYSENNPFYNWLIRPFYR